MSYTAPKTKLIPNPTPRPSFWMHPVGWMKWKSEVRVMAEDEYIFTQDDWNRFINT